MWYFLSRLEDNAWTSSSWKYSRCILLHATTRCTPGYLCNTHRSQDRSAVWMKAVPHFDCCVCHVDEKCSICRYTISSKPSSRKRWQLQCDPSLSAPKIHSIITSIPASNCNICMLGALRLRSTCMSIPSFARIGGREVFLIVFVGLIAVRVVNLYNAIFHLYSSSSSSYSSSSSLTSSYSSPSLSSSGRRGFASAA